MPALKTRPRKTVADLLALPEETRAELIEGEILMSPAPTPRHQEIVARVLEVLGPFARTGRLGKIYPAPVDVVLPSGDVVQPDLVFVATKRLKIVGARIEGAPDLVVEVLSPANPERDRLVKRDLYARNHVPEYWIVDGDARAIEVLRLEGRRYKPAGYFEQRDALASPAFPGLVLKLANIFA